MKTLNKILNKISSNKFSGVYNSLGAFNLFASSMSEDTDKLNLLYTIAFDSLPKSGLTVEESIDTIPTPKSAINCVEKHVLAKEIVKSFKNSEDIYDNELTNLVKTESNFKLPEKYDIIKSASFGKLAVIGNKYHLVNPITNTVTADFVASTPDYNFAELHDLIGEERKAGNIDSVIDMYGDLVLTTRPNVSYELANKIKSLGYEVEEVDQTNYDDPGSEPTYTLRIKLSKEKTPVDSVNSEKKDSDTVANMSENTNEDISKQSNPTPEKRSDGAPSYLVPVTITFDNGEVINTDVNGGRTDEEIKEYFSKNKTFNLGSGSDGQKEDVPAKVVDVKIDRSNYAPYVEPTDTTTFFTVDATKKGEVKVIYGDKLVCSCNDVKSAFDESYNYLKKIAGLDVSSTNTDTSKEEIDFDKELMEAGESKGEKEKVNKEQLEMGKEVEKEHTTNPEIAEKITRDHLKEMPDYYTHLKEMEDNAKTNDAVKSSYAPFMTVDETKKEVTKTAEDVEDNVWVVEKTSAPTIDDQLTLDIFYVVNKNTHVVAHDAGFQPFLFPTQEDAQKYADKLNSQKEASEKPVEKKADENDITSDDNGDEKAQAVSQLTGEVAELTKWTTYGLPTYKSGNEEYAVASDEKEVYNAVVEEVESILDDVGYDAFNWDNMGGIENFVNNDWFEDARKESNESYARDIAESEPERFKEEAKEYGITVGEDIDEDAIYAFVEKMKENQEENPVEWFVNNFGKDAIKDLIKEKKIKFDTHAIADEVINLDGAGHVLSLYDGNEVEQQVNGKTYFLYRQAKKNGGKVTKTAGEELKQFDMKQELDGQKDFETQDDSFKDVSVPEESENTDLVQETMEAKPDDKPKDSFSASELGDNLAYIKQNFPDEFNSIMKKLQSLLVGDKKNIFEFLSKWSQNNFQNFTEMTRNDQTYSRHSQYQEQLKNNVLPLLIDMSEYRKAMEELTKTKE